MKHEAVLLLETFSEQILRWFLWRFQKFLLLSSHSLRAVRGVWSLRRRDVTPILHENPLIKEVNDMA